MLWLHKAKKTFYSFAIDSYLNDSAFTAVKRDKEFLRRYVKGVTFFNRKVKMVAKHPSPLSKTKFFRPFKSNHTTPINCLDLVRGTAEKKKLVKLRISNHKLMIELLEGFKAWAKGVF